MAFGDTWSALTGSGSRSWAALCCSADGTKLAGVTGVSSYVWVSTDSGATWAQKASLGTARTEIVCADDFSVILANTNPSSSAKIIRSTDFGATWTSVGSENPWRGLCLSNDGQIAYACYGGSGRIHKSSDGGATWSLLSGSPSKSWEQLACSANGSIVYATVYGASSTSYKSTNAGVTWTEILSLTSLQGITCSDDGQTVIAGTRAGNYYYVSSDGGSSWATFNKSSSPIPIWCIGCSPSGQHIIIGGTSSKSYASSDYGVSWSNVAINAPSNDAIYGVVVLAGGTAGYAAPNSDYVFALSAPLTGAILTRLATEVLSSGDSAASLSRLAVEALSTGDGAANLGLLSIEVLSSSLEAPPVSVSRMNLEVLAPLTSVARMNMEVLTPVVSTSVARMNLEALIPFTLPQPAKRRKQMWVIT